MKKIDGLPVGNAHMPIRLEVTKQDITKGARKNANSCAIAVAAVRQIKGVTAAKVHLGVIYLCQNGRWRRWHTSSAARTEIIVFDRGGRFVPGQYDLLPVPPQSLLKRTRRGPRPGPKRRRRRKPHYVEDVRDSAHRNDPDN
jgi:hypothetical protein